MTERRRQRIWVVMPAYNEELSLPKLLDRIEDTMFENGLNYTVVIVDDGSTDRTIEVANAYSTKMPLVVERHTVNQGLGATMRDGLIRAAELSDPRDIIITMDADNSHTPELIIQMTRRVREGCDVVVASRYQPGSVVRGLSISRRVLSFWGSRLFRVILPIPGIRDYTCGYRAYRAEILKQVVSEEGPAFFDQEGFQCVVDILLRLRKKDLIFGEVPLILRYDLKEGASKMKIWKTIGGMFRLMFQRRLES